VPDEFSGFWVHLTSKAINKLLALYSRLRPANKHEQHGWGALQKAQIRFAANCMTYS